VAEKSATFKNVATKDSHLDCRAPLTLIVALQMIAVNAISLCETMKQTHKQRSSKGCFQFHELMIIERAPVKRKNFL
jgi:hypothetical protein